MKKRVQLISATAAVAAAEEAEAEAVVKKAVFVEEENEENVVVNSGMDRSSRVLSGRSDSSSNSHGQLGLTVGGSGVSRTNRIM